jgi:predicted unusual protein kinase regulating ubiquinone biosynthesis (AarF/ABC1/UbiB family)
MELAHGRRWNELGDAPQDLRDRWGEAVFRFFFGSMARLSMFNADPHPGNYLFHDDGTVTFLDFGCVKRATESFNRGAFGQIAAALANDGERLVQNFVEHGFARAEDPPPADKTLAWYRQNFEPLVEPQPFTFTPRFVAEMLGRMADMDQEVMRRVTVPTDFVFTNRLFAGLYSILGDLGATADWRAIFDEQRTLIPTTDLGRVESTFFEAQGSA